MAFGSKLIRIHRRNNGRTLLRRDRLREQSGQVLVIGVIVVLGLSMISIATANIGAMVAEKIHVQDSVDAAAYSAAVINARYMNLAAYLNRAIAANYNSMMFNTALWSVVDTFDHTLAVVIAILYQVSVILTILAAVTFGATLSAAQNVDRFADILRDYVHTYLHDLNGFLDDFFAQHDDAQDLNQYIEKYNTYVLSTYQGLLYAAAQSARHDVAKQVALKMDPEVVTTTVLGLGAESVSYDELARAVDWVINEDKVEDHPLSTFQEKFDSLGGDDANEDANYSDGTDAEDHVALLAATTEASLDKFTAGRTRDGDFDFLRNLDTLNLIPAGGAETALEIACEVATLSLGTCDANFDMTLGGQMRDYEEDKAINGPFLGAGGGPDHVPFIARRRGREVQFFGLDLDIRLDLTDDLTADLGFIAGLLGVSQGHTSGDKWADVANMKNAIDLFNDFDTDRAFECFLTGCNWNKLNTAMAAAIGLIPPLVVDDHWDGITDEKPVHFAEIYPPGPGQIAAIEYTANRYAEGLDGGYIGVPKYDWDLDIDNVGIPHYHYDSSASPDRPGGNSRGGKLEGPTVVVVGIKDQEDINGLQGLGIGNPYSITAMSAAQTYYLRNPNREDEKPSMWNPYWVARLRPVNSPDTPIVARRGLPYVMSMGLTMEPTH